MALETRKKGINQYYYRKRREAGRVVSEYLGSGPIGELAAMHQEIDNERRLAQRQAQERERQPVIIAEQALGELHQITALLVKAQMLVAGYHQHKGTWRKRRTKTNDANC